MKSEHKDLKEELAEVVTSEHKDLKKELAEPEVVKSEHKDLREELAEVVKSEHKDDNDDKIYVADLNLWIISVSSLCKSRVCTELDI